MQKIKKIGHGNFQLKVIFHVKNYTI